MAIFLKRILRSVSGKKQAGGSGHLTGSILLTPLFMKGIRLLMLT